LALPLALPGPRAALGLTLSLLALAWLTLPGRPAACVGQVAASILES
jgi:hypothetical protein